jgi:hypothetical protein
MPASCLSGFLGNCDILGFLGNLMSVQAAARQGARIYTFWERRRGYEGAGMLFSPAAARSAPELEQRQVLAWAAAEDPGSGATCPRQVCSLLHGLNGKVQPPMRPHPPFYSNHTPREDIRVSVHRSMFLDPLNKNRVVEQFTGDLLILCLSRCRRMRCEQRSRCMRLPNTETTQSGRK